MSTIVPKSSGKWGGIGRANLPVERRTPARYNHRVRPPGDRESDMPTVEERLAYIEGRVEEHTRSMEEFRSGVLRLDQRMDSLDQKVDRVRDELASRIEAVRGELTSRCDRIELRLDGLDQKLSRGFYWLVGMQFTILLAIVGTLLQTTR
jgi:ABC-type phosphate transport system auxiliary subunit